MTLASEQSHVSQPAVTQAIGKLEAQAGGALFERTRHGFILTERGEILAARVRRAFARLDPAFADVSPRLALTATTAQLQALIATREAENFTLAARKLGITQPTVHRAVTQLEQEAGRALFERTAHGVMPSQQCQALAHAARLAFSELDQGEADLAEFDGREVGRIVVGTLPLSRSVLLPQALVAFRQSRPTFPVTVLDGPYDDLLAGLRRGEIDCVVGALRVPLPIKDVTQEFLFNDRLTVLAGKNHPLAARKHLGLEDLAEYSWVVPRAGTPSREHFDYVYQQSIGHPPASVIESGSILLMREVLSSSSHLGCISRHQAEAEISKGLVVPLDVEANWPARPIGIATRADWTPTAAQGLLLDLLRQIVAVDSPL